MKQWELTPSNKYDLILKVDKYDILVLKDINNLLPSINETVFDINKDFIYTKNARYSKKSLHCCNTGKERLKIEAIIFNTKRKCYSYLTSKFYTVKTNLKESYCQKVINNAQINISFTDIANGDCYCTIDVNNIELFRGFIYDLENYKQVHKSTLKHIEK